MFFKKRKKVLQPQKVCNFMSVENGEKWGEYITSDDFKQKYEALVRNLDDASIKLIDLIIERMRFFYKIGEYSDRCYFYPEHWLSEEEKAGALAVEKSKFQDKYKNRLPVEFFEQSVLYFHSGLKLVPQSVLDYIKNKDFIDGGACIGDSSMILSEYSPHKVYAFEPIVENIKYINETIKLNKITNIEPIPLGLGAKNETIEITYSESDYGSSSSTFSQDGQKRNIDIVTVDKYVEDNNLTFGLIKLDVEGLESDIIAGSLNAIKKHRPVLLISIYHNPKDFFEIKPLIENLNLNYKFSVQKLACGCTHGETMLIGYPNELE